MKKISVSLPDDIVEILDKEVIGKIGKSHSDTIRSIVVKWLGKRVFGEGQQTKRSSIERRTSTRERNILHELTNHLQ